MRMRYFFSLGCVVFLLALPSWAENDSGANKKKISPYSSQIWKTRPVRRDIPLREENIDDREVLQIEGVMRERYPGSLVYISAVTTGCPCEDGPSCTDQVWSVAQRGSRYDELALSKIDGEWQVGPLQDWWLVRDRIWAIYKASRKDPDESRRIDFREYLRRLNAHNEAYPSCVVSVAADDR